MLGLIGGSRAYAMLARGAFHGEMLGEICTPFGKSQPLYRLQIGGRDVLFLSRHGEKGYSIAAPFVNYRANIYALKEAGAEQVIAWSGPGAINRNLQIGQYVVPDDLIDMTRRRKSTFFEGAGWGFIRMNPAFCPSLAAGLADALGKLGAGFSVGGTYVCTEGPRLETPAEIRMLGLLGGDLVGMTLCPEAFLARELELCYAAVCYVTNFAEGVEERPNRPGTLFGGMATDEELLAQERAADRLPQIVQRFCELYDDTATRCTCRQAMLRYRQSGSVSNDWHSWVRHDTES